MVDAELGLAIAWNGCIYNYEALRDELAGHGYRFFSHSDTEVLLKAYHHWGDRFVEQLHGMFAFAITERDSGRALLGRDRLGIKPMYLSSDAHRIRFASTLPALVAGGGVDTRIDPVALHHYLSFHSVVPAPLTILRGAQAAASLAAGDRARRHPDRDDVLEPRVHPPRRPRPPTGPKTTGRTRFSRRCAPPCAAGWSPMCPSAACCPAAWTPA